MIDKTLMELAKSAAKAATDAGASDARITASRSRDVTVEWRDKKLDRIRESTKQSLTVTLFVDGRYSVNNTSDVRDASVKKYVEDAVRATRYLAPDKHRFLPDPKRYEGMVTDDLEIYDPAIQAVSPQQRLAVAAELEEAARTGGDASLIASVTSEVSDYEYRSVCLNTNGLEAGEQGTSTWRSCSVSVKDRDDRRPRGSAYGGGTFAEDLPPCGEVGRDAYKKAVEQMGSRQADTGRYEVIVLNRATPTLSRHLFAPLFGGALQQKRSFMDGKLGDRVAAEILTVTSNPHLKRGLASTAWDSEGMATQPLAVVDRGLLKTFFLDTYYASKLGMSPTTGDPTNIVWKGGKRDSDAMVSGATRAILITGFLGGNSNSTTGDFSLGIKGFLIEKGEVIHPISEMNMAGNHLSLWKDLAEVGSDPWPYASNRAPTLRFSNVQCSGSKG